MSRSHIEKLQPRTTKNTAVGIGSFAELTKPLIFAMVIHSQPETLPDTVCK